MKRLHFVLAAVVSLLILAAVMGLRRVAPDEQAVKVARDGTVTQADAGWHFVGPGVELVKYPVGEWHARVPETGTAPVTFANGDTLGVAFDYTLVIPPRSAESLYSQFSKEFAPAFQKLVISAAEIEAAALEGASLENLR